MTDDEAPSQTQVVVAGIRAMLGSREIIAGSRLPVERELAERFGVSRGSLREGVRALVALGVLETRQGDGTYVTSLEADRLLEPVGLLADLADEDDARDLLAVRRVLEGEAAALAAAHAADDDLARLRAVLDEAARLVEPGDAHPDAALEASLEAPLASSLEASLEADRAFHRLVAAAGGNAPLAALVEQLGLQTRGARARRAVQDADSVRAAIAEHRLVLQEIERRDPERARLRMTVHLLGVEESVERPAV